MNMLITGGAGFIGSHAAEEFINKGYDVTVIDNLCSGKKENLPSSVNFIEADITDYNFSSLFQKKQFDYIIHFAAQIDVRKSVENPIFDAHINIEGLLNILQSTVNSNIKKFVFISSAGVMYGNTDEPADELTPPAPVSPYGVSKLSGEHYLASYHHNHNLNYTILRLANVYGPRQDPLGEAGVVAIFANQMINREQSKLFGFGELIRDYVYVKDVINAVVKCLDKGNGEIFNISTSEPTTVKELFEKMRSNFTDIPDPLFLPARPGELDRSIVNYHKAKNILGWAPLVDLNQGLTSTIEYFKNLKK